MPAIRDARTRLEKARAALREAEHRAGLDGAAQREVARHSAVLTSGALALQDKSWSSASSALSPQVAPLSDPWEEMAQRLGPGQGGVCALTGSRDLLLAAAARRQGAYGWCAVLGGEDLGWCAAQEVGLVLERTLVVPCAGMAREEIVAALPRVLAALMEGVEVLLLSARISRCVPARLRRSVLARARERGVLVLLEEAWEGAMLMEARPQHNAAEHGEMRAGRLTRLNWVLHDPRRARSSWLWHDAEGLHHEVEHLRQKEAPSLDQESASVFSGLSVPSGLSGTSGPRLRVLPGGLS